MANMKTSKNGINLIKKYEGCKLKAYLCPAEIYTIGYGHTSGVRKDEAITYEQAEDFLKKDLEKFEKSVNKYVNVEVTQSMFDALISFSFNVGATAFRKSTLLQQLNKGDYNSAADEFLRWNKGGGKVLAGLTKRRKAEKQLFMSEGIPTSKKSDIPSLKGYKGFSVVDGLKQFGYETDFAYRKVIATKVGISNYKGTVKQNTALLNYLKTH